jgi:hypothetical protein
MVLSYQFCVDDRNSIELRGEANTVCGFLDCSGDARAGLITGVVFSVYHIRLSESKAYAIGVPAQTFAYFSPHKVQKFRFLLLLQKKLTEVYGEKEES